MMTRPLRSLLIALAVAAAGSLPAESQAIFAVERIAEGTFVLVPQERFDDLDSNTTVVIGTTGVLVVDSGGSKETGRLIVAEIKKLTPLPVRYIVNTHWHYDHVLGNAALLETWPGAAVVAHDETARIASTWARYYPTRALASMPATRARLESQVRTGLGTNGQPLAPYELKVTQAQHENIARLEQKLRESTYVLPSLTFSTQLRLDLGNRSVDVMNFGRGNTPGDAIVQIPDAGVIIAGDLLVNPVPYGFNSFPASWIMVMRRLDELRGDIIVPGHGPVQRDRAYVAAVTGLLADVVREVRAAVSRNLTLDETRKSLDLSAWRRRLTQGDATRDWSFTNNFEVPIVERAWREARGEF